MTTEFLEWALGILAPITVVAFGSAFKFWSEARGWKISYEREKEATDTAREEIARTKFMQDLASTMTETFRQVANERRSVS